MHFSRRIATHLGTTARAFAIGLTLLPIACTDALSPLEPEEDAEIEAGAAGDADARVEDDLDAGDASVRPDSSAKPDVQPPSSCQSWSETIDQFVAKHRSCSVDADCAIAGDCSHADWRAVRTDAVSQVNTMLRAKPECAALDGPGANAVCRKGACSVVQASTSCGSAPASACPTGTERSMAGCGDVAPTFQDGCHAPCTSGGAATQCAPGYSCQQTTINPCPRPMGGGVTCDACGSLVTQCLPAPSCQVKLSLTFQSKHEVARLASAQSTVAELWLENLTDQALTLKFDQPCHGPRVTGLGNYDLWSSCLAGACPTDPVATEVKLAPKQKLAWQSPIITTSPTDCNPQGLPVGDYKPSFQLENVTGASVCGPEAAQLTVAAP